MLQKLYLYEDYLAPGMHMCIKKEPASGIWCLQTISKSGGNEPWDSPLLCLQQCSFSSLWITEGCPLMLEGMVPPQQQVRGQKD